MSAIAIYHQLVSSGIFPQHKPAATLRAIMVRSWHCCAMIALSSLLSLAQGAKPLRGRLSLPGKDWGVVLELPGFTVNTVETMADRRRYMVAENSETHLIVSLTLEEVKQSNGASCRDSLEKKSKKPPFKIRNVTFSQAGQLDVMEYTVPEVSGRPVNQKSLFACEFHEGVYVDLHVSKINFEPADAPLFSQVLNSMRIESVQRSSTELLQQASRLYLQRDYHGAIGPYSQVLEMEKGHPALQKPLWYVLIDNLGMSYGMTGDLQKAKETFEYGIAKDSTYPLFYYNLACTYAEMGKTDEASQNLRKAFEFKANVLAGETMPDPRTDDSFKKLMKDSEFRQLTETLAGHGS
jgi:hypothetical protein